MKKYYGKLGLLVLLLAVALVLTSCAGAGAAQQEEESNASGSDTQGMQEHMGGMQGMTAMGSESTAPHMMAQTGAYSDERFIDMMVPHHQGAIDMAKVAQEKAEHPEIKQLADNVISSQQQEIDELKAIREQEYGSSETPAHMDPSEMESMGMLTPDQLANQQPFDKAFIDSMLPHHSSAIVMASGAYMHSDNSQITRIARGIIDAQATEVGQLIGWREQWYPEKAA